MTFVAEAGDLLAHSLDQEMTMAITGQIVVPRLATWCAVYLDDERGEPVLQQVWHADERRGRGPAQRAAQGRGREDLPDTEDAALAGELTTLPLLARGRGIGHLVLGRPAGSPLRDDVLLVTESIVRRAALAIDNARAHGALLATGQALQASLLPPSLPEVPGLDVGVVYEAAGEGTAAGGDFYDIFPVEAGSWCFVVGDVCGTGAEAAAVTGLARHTIRSLTRAGFTVAATLERLNEAILDEGERSRFLTLVCGIFREKGGRVQMSLVNAGHPAPFVTSAGSPVRRIGTPQLLLGVIEKVEYVAEDHVLERGELLVALTDGVLERRDGGRMLDDHGVSAELARAGDLPAQAVAERLRRLVVEFATSPQSDDIAILALRVRQLTTPPRPPGSVRPRVRPRHRPAAVHGLGGRCPEHRLAGRASLPGAGGVLTVGVGRPLAEDAVVHTSRSVQTQISDTFRRRDFGQPGQLGRDDLVTCRTYGSWNPGSRPPGGTPAPGCSDRASW